MLIFKNKKVGILEYPINPKLIEQYRKYTDTYEEITQKKVTVKTNDVDPAELSLKELKEKADKLNIEYSKNIKKADLIELIKKAE